MTIIRSDTSVVTAAFHTIILHTRVLICNFVLYIQSYDTQLHVYIYAYHYTPENLKNKNNSVSYLTPSTVSL